MQSSAVFAASSQSLRLVNVINEKFINRFLNHMKVLLFIISLFLIDTCIASDGVFGQPITFESSDQSAAYKTSIIVLLSQN